MDEETLLTSCYSKEPKLTKKEPKGLNKEPKLKKYRATKASPSSPGESKKGKDHAG